MKPLGKLLLAATATVAVAGVAGLAAAEIKNAHLLTVQLPDGSVEHIQYAGDQPPKVSVETTPVMMIAPVDMVGVSPIAQMFGPASPFADLQRISAAMDRQAAAMLQQVEMTPMSPMAANGPMLADLNRLPPGVQGFSMVSTSTGNGMCMRSVEYRSMGPGKAPKVLTRTSGNCGPAGAATGAHSATTTTAEPFAASPPAADAPHLVQATYHR
ncbi:MAG TPA: hypothetical protein VFE18_14415 [Phenylobacterium sp.]|jgi:hypothetical protein|uniref:hypothetical protein n=1 Tax=Phenylobacterium sp. TaxID=1871053 RepID=UPI002D4E5515|nr:hypothetical protein [Phenylobacterium sp.]HZZ69364.1 hypothetical protein [Phenylobacterium sp.]